MKKKNEQGDELKPIRTRGTVRVLTVLLALMGVAVAVVEVVAQMATKRMEQQADLMAEMQAKSINQSVKKSFELNTMKANSFLSGLMLVEDVTDTVTGEKITLHVLNQKSRNRLSVDNIYNSLSAFLEVNPNYISAMFILEPGIIADAPKRGLAALVRHGDSTFYDLLDTNDLFHHPGYKQAFQSPYGYVSSVSTVANKMEKVITYVFPIWSEDRKLVGEFQIDCPLSDLSDLLISKRSELDEKCLILAPDLTVIASTRAEHNGGKFDAFIKESIGDYKPAYLEQLQHCVRSRQQFKFRMKLQNEYRSIYFFPVYHTDYMLSINMSEERMHQTITNFKVAMLGVSLTGLLLILICSGFAFRSFRKKEDEQLLMRGELNIAADIQRDFLPSGGWQNETVDLWAFQRTARQVGGDLYDYVVRDRKLFFCVGDVSGKGIPASLFMAIASSHFRSICRNEDNPKNIIEQMNTCLSDRNDSMMFCTMFLGVLNLDNGVLDFCNAGHNPPVLKTNSSCNYLKVKPNIMLGVWDDYVYEPQQLQLYPNDVLFIYTDGITEAFSTDGTQYGNQRLYGQLNGIADSDTAEQISRSILDSVSGYAKGAEQSDDITMLCLKMK